MAAALKALAKGRADSQWELSSEKLTVLRKATRSGARDAD